MDNLSINAEALKLFWPLDHRFIKKIFDEPTNLLSLPVETVLHKSL